MSVARVAATVVMAAAVARAQYGPDPAGVPDDFKCEWRKLALAYASELRPDSAALVHDALQLSSACPAGDSARPEPRSLPRASAGLAAAANKAAAAAKQAAEAATANAHGFVEAFADGYHTLVGERGVQLSGG